MSYEFTSFLFYSVHNKYELLAIILNPNDLPATCGQKANTMYRVHHLSLNKGLGTDDFLTP